MSQEGLEITTRHAMFSCEAGLTQCYKLKCSQNSLPFRHIIRQHNGRHAMAKSQGIVMNWDCILNIFQTMSAK